MTGTGVIEGKIPLDFLWNVGNDGLGPGLEDELLSDDGLDLVVCLHCFVQLHQVITVLFCNRQGVHYKFLNLLIISFERVSTVPYLQ
jgi:hypothetical protein